MDQGITDLYRLPDVAEYEDLHLLTLWENCALLENQLESVKDRMSESDRQVLECYLAMRDDLEHETVKAAMRWSRQNYM